MALPTEHVVVCPVVIGRQEHLDALDRALTAAASGAGHVIALGGEAGLGKSRLVTEAKRRASGEHGAPRMRIMQGQCFEPDASQPFAPIVDLLRTCLATHAQPEMLECMGADAAEIMQILPELATLIPGLVSTSALNPEQERRRIFHALIQFFTRATAHEPLLLVIEDLHWSDDTSLEFLSSLARRISTLPALLILTFRTDEMRPGLRHFLTGLDRDHLSSEWQLARLSRPQVSDMISAIFDLDTPARPEFVEALYALTEGNPFFLEEVLKSLVASGDIFFAHGGWDRKPLDEIRIPRSVQAAVAARTSQLSDEAQRVLTLASVAGRRFDFGLLQRLANDDEHTLLRLIKELIAAQLVVEESADHFAFRHALTQQAISTGLLARERRALHRTIAEMMREMYGGAIEPHLPELAHHFYAAESWHEAYYYCQRVGENARVLNAAQSAIDQFGRALEAAAHLGIQVPSSLVRSRGQAYDTLGDFDRARADYEQAFAAAQLAHDNANEWQGLIDLGFLWSGRDYDRAGVYFHRASELAETMQDAKLRAWSANRLGNWLVNTGKPKEGLAEHLRALAIFEGDGDVPGTAETYDLIGMANGIYGDLPASIEAHTRAIALLRPLGPSPTLSSSLASRATYMGPNIAEPLYAALGTHDAAERGWIEALQVAETIGSPAASSFASWAGGANCAGFGYFGKALALASEGLRIATEIGHDQWVTGAKYTLGQIYVLMLAPNHAREQLESAVVMAHEIGSSWWIGNTASYLALAHVLQRDSLLAEAALAAAWPQDHLPDNAGERRVHWVWGMVAFERGDNDTALMIADHLIETAPGGPYPQYIPSLWHLRGDALAGLGRNDEALAALTRAKEGAIERGARPFLWQIHRSLGRLHTSRRQPDEAERDFAAARTIIAELGKTIDDSALREQFEQTALTSFPGAKPIRPSRAAKDAFGGLTAREREVAALVATGMSNRDIAEHLVLGERTIETHVSNVLSKLQFSSRAQVAAWVVEKGLARTS